MVRFSSRLTLLLLPRDCRTFLSNKRPAVMPGNLRHSDSGNMAITVLALGNAVFTILFGSSVTMCSSDGSTVFRVFRLRQSRGQHLRIDQVEARRELVELR